MSTLSFLRHRSGVLAGSLLCMAGWVSGWATTAMAAEATVQEHETLFESRVRPLLAAKCQSCHGDTVAEAGLRLDSRRSLLAGSDSGPVLVPGDTATSKLLLAVRQTGDLAMPPDEKLSPEEITALETWVTAGAPWSGPGGDADASQPTPAASMDERLATSLENHWAFTPPVRHPAPDLPASFDPSLRADWSTSAIDRFIGGTLTAAGLAPSPEAAPRDLIRRLSYDLTGLPPSADEVDAFCAAAAGGAAATDAAVVAAIDRLLASTEHAEHWARKWLDLARYSDTMGYVVGDADNRYPFAWTYRDWVVDALHRDLPYDQFVTLQLAADRVEPPVPQSDLAALGFLTVGRTFLGNTHDIIDDRIDLVTRGLLGLTVACSRCHDHKYEPVTAADYYALHGIFASCAIPQELPIVGDSPPGPEAEAFATKLAELEAAVTVHQTAVQTRAIREAVAHTADYFLETARPSPRAADNRLPPLADGYELGPAVLDPLKELLDKAEPSHPILGAWAAARGTPDTEVAAVLQSLRGRWGQSPDPQVVNPLVLQELVSVQPMTLRQLAEAYARLVARVAPESAGGPAVQPGEPAELTALRMLLGMDGTPLVVTRGRALKVATRDEKAERQKRKKAVTSHMNEAEGSPIRAMVLLDTTPVDSHIFLRGNPGRPGEKVERRLPKLLGGAAVARESSGRLDLARAIVSPDNPLAPRVIVNWAWTHHFGRGLVDTPGDLGLRGDPPTHPHLLDDLARRFVDEGQWSLRWLHREIVTSRVWRQSSAIGEDIADRDPDNRLFGRANRRRLDWEAWRDSMLVAAGTLDLTHRGGRGVDPLSEAVMNTRSLYGRLDRQYVPGILRMFDIANPDTAVHVRTKTTVPQQSLAVLNAPLAVAAARRVATRVDHEIGDTSNNDVRIVALWRAVLGRSPSPDEQAAAAAWIAEETPRDVAGKATFTRWDRLAHALLATSEFQFVD
jgi:cytochrome c553